MSEPRRADAPETRSQGHRTRILIVDAADATRSAIGDYFVARGFEVLRAADGVEAITRTLARPVDAVVMSLTLPGLEGYETAAILRQISPGVRIILTTEADVDARPRERRRTESFRCFPKPLDLEAIARAIGEAKAGSGEPEGREAAPDEEGEE